MSRFRYGLTALAAAGIALAALLGPVRPAQAREPGQAAEALADYARDMLGVPGVAVGLDEETVSLTLDVDGKDGLGIFLDMLRLSVAAGIAAPETRRIEITLARGGEPLSRATLPTRAARRYGRGAMSDRAFFAKWQVEDLAASAPAAAGAGQPRAGRGAKGARIAQGAAAAAGRRAVRMSLAADLDGDGLLESVQLVRTERLAVGPCFGLEVRDDDGSLLWRGPKRVAEPETDPFRFCELDIGVSLPQILGDIDGDGFVELVSPQIQSDVRPVIFRVLRWDGRAFRLVRRAALQADPGKPRSFRWRKRPALGDLWVDSFLALEAPGQLRVTIMRMQAGAVSGPSEARLQAAGRGFRLTRWIGQPIGKAGKPKAAGAGGGGGSQAVGTLCDRLWYERNAIYAAKGYCFQTERARRAFPNSCFPPWGKLNRAEQRKVDRIRARERALGCP